VGTLVEFLLDLGVLVLGPWMRLAMMIVSRKAAMASYCTPPGCRAVLLTLSATIVRCSGVLSDEEWKLPFCCFCTCSRRKSLEALGKLGVKARTGVIKKNIGRERAAESL